VITTMPHATEAPSEQQHRLARFKEANETARKVARAHQGQVIFVDLDLMMTGKMEKHFMDLGHMSQAGQRFKAKAIGLAIMEHMGRQGGEPGSDG